MKHLFIINPAAGSRDRTEDYKKQIHSVCDPLGIDYRIEVSQAPGQCRELAAAAAKTGEEYRIYACGGDGTLNEVVSGAAGASNVAVTAFAGGSGNDFTKIFNDPSQFFHLEKLLDAKEVSFDLIRCNGDICLNICSVGLDARIGRDVSQYKRLPFLHGFRAYALSTVVNVLRGISEHYRVEIDGQVFDSNNTLICACNGRYYGGGFNPVPEADPADGKMDVLVVEKVSRLKLAQVIGKYKSGQYRALPKYIRHFRTDYLRILCDTPTPINLDGEIRTYQEVEFSIAPEKIRFFYPKDLTWCAKEPVATGANRN